MSSYAIMTNVGRNKEAAALANGTSLSITEIAWGDGDRSPGGGEAALLNEVGRKLVQGTGLVPDALNTAFFEILLDVEEGPFVIREAGLFDEDGDLIAVAKYDPPVNKPKDTVTALIRINVVFSDLENLILKVQSTDAYVPVERRVGAGNGLIGGGDLSGDRVLAVAFATKADAEAGTSETKVMSPKRVAEWLKKVTGLGDLANFYHGEKANPALRMGSASATNFDGVTFDEGTDTFIMKADADKAGDDPGRSVLRAHKVRIASTGDVSAESTLHGLEIGDFAGGNGVKFDANEMLSRVGDKDVSIFYQNILQTGDIISGHYSTDDVPDSWLIGENFRGDTSVSLDEITGYCHLIGRLAFVSVILRFSGFSIPASSDAPILTRFKLDELGKAAGWFEELTGSNIGMASGQLQGVDWDSPWVPMYCSASSKTGTYPNTLYLSVADTQDIPVQSSDATELHVRATVLVSVGD